MHKTTMRKHQEEPFQIQGQVSTNIDKDIEDLRNQIKLLKQKWR